MYTYGYPCSRHWGTSGSLIYDGCYRAIIWLSRTWRSAAFWRGATWVIHFEYPAMTKIVQFIYRLSILTLRKMKTDVNKSVYRPVFWGKPYALHTRYRHQIEWMPATYFHCFLHINSYPPNATYMHQWIGSALVQIMACRLFGAKPLSKSILYYCQADLRETLQWNFNQNTKWRNVGHFVQGRWVTEIPVIYYCDWNNILIPDKNGWRTFCWRHFHAVSWRNRIVLCFKFYWICLLKIE